MLKELDQATEALVKIKTSAEREDFYAQASDIVSVIEPLIEAVKSLEENLKKMDHWPV